MSTMADDPRVLADRPGLIGTLATYRSRIARGDIGQLPVLIGLLVIWLVFYAASGGTFFSPFNLVNLALQMAAVGTIATTRCARGVTNDTGDSSGSATRLPCRLSAG